MILFSSFKQSSFRKSNHLSFIIIIFSFIHLTNNITICPSDKYYYKDVCYKQCTFQEFFTVNAGVNSEGIQNLYIKTLGSQVCVSTCSPQCSQCLTYADFCTKCYQTTPDSLVYILVNQGKCFSNKCPDYFYENITLKTCQSCQNLSYNCKNCSTNYECLSNGGTNICDPQQEINCLQCDSGYYSYLNKSKNNILQCITFIPDGYINLNFNLQQCSQPCLTCLNNSMNCLSCKINSLYNYQCIQTCPDSHYSKQAITIFNGQNISTFICQRCEPQCNRCSNQTFCLSCLPSYYLVQASGLCLNFCPQKTYINTTLQKCMDCKQPCLRCYNQNQCKQCTTNLYLFQNSCKDICPNRTYQSQINDLASVGGKKLVCLNCQPPCQTCIDQLKCTSCIYSLYLVYFNNNNSCLQNCPDGYKRSSNNSNCIPCDIECQTCDQTKCLTCSILYGTKYVLLNNSCIQKCLTFEYYQTNQIIGLINQTICRKCPNQCQMCHNQFQCTKCKQRYYYYNKSCLQYCPDTSPVQTLILSSFPNQYQCQKCSKKYCLYCTKSDYCTVCIDFQTELNSSIVLWQGNCITQCPIDYDKLYDQISKKWICKIKQITMQQAKQMILQAKGVILKPIFSYLGSYCAGGILILCGIIFFILWVSKYERGLFLPFLSGLLFVPQVYAIGMSFYYHFMYNIYDYVDKYKYNPWVYVFGISIILLILLNIICIGTYLRIFMKDISFLQWAKHASCKSYILIFIVYLISLIDFKIQNIFWSKFSFFPVLQNIQKLKPFTIFSGLSLLPLTGIFICLLVFTSKQTEIKQIYIDALIVIAFNTIINLISLKRPLNLFQFQLISVISDSKSQTNPKLNIHRIAYSSDKIFIQPLKPTQTYQQQTVCRHFKSGRQHFQDNLTSQRSISQLSLLTDNKNSHKNDRNSQKDKGFLFEIINQESSYNQLCIKNKSKQKKRIKQNALLNNLDLNSSIFSQQQSFNTQKNIKKQLLSQSQQFQPKSKQQKLFEQKIKSKTQFSLLQSQQNSRLYQTSRSQVQTEQTSQKQELNNAISEIDQGSEKAQLGSMNQSEQMQKQVQKQIKRQNMDLNENEKQQFLLQIIYNNKQNNQKDKIQQNEHSQAIPHQKKQIQPNNLSYYDEEMKDYTYDNFKDISMLQNNSKINDFSLIQINLKKSNSTSQMPKRNIKLQQDIQNGKNINQEQKSEQQIRQQAQIIRDPLVQSNLSQHLSVYQLQPQSLGLSRNKTVLNQDQQKLKQINVYQKQNKNDHDQKIVNSLGFKPRQYSGEQGQQDIEQGQQVIKQGQFDVQQGQYTNGDMSMANNSDFSSQYQRNSNQQQQPLQEPQQELQQPEQQQKNMQQRQIIHNSQIQSNSKVRQKQDQIMPILMYQTKQMEQLVQLANKQKLSQNENRYIASNQSRISKNNYSMVQKNQKSNKQLSLIDQFNKYGNSIQNVQNINQNLQTQKSIYQKSKRTLFHLGQQMNQQPKQIIK